MSNLQLTLAILKPHILKHPYALSVIRQTIAENQFEVVQRGIFQLSDQLVNKFYEEHALKFFYNRLHTFMRR